MQIFLASLVSVLMTTSEENISCVVQQGQLREELFFQASAEILGAAGGLWMILSLGGKACSPVGGGALVYTRF